MVFRMAGPELMRVHPRQEGEEPREENIGKLCFKDRAVKQLVEAVQEKSPEGSVDKKQKDHERPRETAD